MFESKKPILIILLQLIVSSVINYFRINKTIKMEIIEDPVEVEMSNRIRSENRDIKMKIADRGINYDEKKDLLYKAMLNLRTLIDYRRSENYQVIIRKNDENKRIFFNQAYKKNWFYYIQIAFTAYGLTKTVIEIVNAGSPMDSLPVTTIIKLMTKYLLLGGEAGKLIWFLLTPLFILSLISLIWFSPIWVMYIISLRFIGNKLNKDFSYKFVIYLETCTSALAFILILSGSWFIRLIQSENFFDLMRDDFNNRGLNDYLDELNSNIFSF